MKLKFTTWKAPAQFQFQLGIVETENINYTNHLLDSIGFSRSYTDECKNYDNEGYCTL